MRRGFCDTKSMEHKTKGKILKQPDRKGRPSKKEPGSLGCHLQGSTRCGKQGMTSEDDVKGLTESKNNILSNMRS